MEIASVNQSESVDIDIASLNYTDSVDIRTL